jgi:hypothetical protein
MRWLLWTILSWLVGLAVYLAVLKGLFGRTIAYGDLLSVLGWSWLAGSVAASVIYAPCFVLLKKLLGGRSPAYLFALAGAALGLVPTLVIALVLGGTLYSMQSPEAFLFTCWFSAFGFVFGYGFAAFHAETPRVA